jgi:hypothetical protein
LTRKDLLNIEHCFNVRQVQHHPNDATSVYAWVNQMSKSDANPVLLYKHQRSQHPMQCNNISDQDFILAIQTPTQTEAFKREG